MKRVLAEFNDWMEESGYYPLFMDWLPAVILLAVVIGSVALFINHFTGEGETIMAIVGCAWAILALGAIGFIALLAAEFLFWYLLAREPRKGGENG